MRSLTTALLALVVGAAACGGDPAGDDARRPRVVVTTSILGDVVTSAFGEVVEVDIIIPKGADPHAFSPSPGDAARLREADLVVAVGLDLEEGLADVVAAAARDGVAVVELGPEVDPLPVVGGGEAHSTFDPHFWFDPVRMERAVALLETRLVELMPSAAEALQAGASRYRGLLRELDADISDLVASVDPGLRKLVTNHDSLGYFAARYGFEVVGTVIPGGTTAAEPSAADIADLISVIGETGVSAIFAETTRPMKLAEVVAAEAGRAVRVVELFTGTLGPPDSGAETYLGFLRVDAERIVRALNG